MNIMCLCSLVMAASHGSCSNTTGIGVPHRGEYSGMTRCMMCHSHAMHSPCRDCNGGLQCTWYLPASIMLRTRPSKGWISVLPHAQQGSAMAFSFQCVTRDRKPFAPNILYNYQK